MKNYYKLSFLILLFLSSCSGRKIQEVKHFGILYEKYQYIVSENGSFVRDGYYKKWNKNGQIIEDGSYENNKKTGEWKVYHEDGVLEYVRNYDAGIKDGYFMEYNNGNPSNEGYYDKSVKTGTWKSYYSNGTLERLFNYDKGELNGLTKLWDEDGNIWVEANYAKGNLEGKFKRYYTNGEVKTLGYHLNGKKEGVWESYTEEGIVTKKRYKKGEDITILGKWRVDNSFTVEYLKDNQCIITKDDGAILKTEYVIFDSKEISGLQYFNSNKPSTLPLSIIDKLSISNYVFREYKSDSLIHATKMD